MGDWLNLVQTWAWIAFRDHEAVESITTEENRSASILYNSRGEYRDWPEDERQSSADKQLQSALERKALVAYVVEGFKKEEVDPAYWAANKSWRCPSEVRVQRKDVERLWPAEVTAPRTMYDEHAVKALWFEIKNAAWGRNERGRKLQEAYQKRISKKCPHISTFHRWIAKWESS